LSPLKPSVSIPLVTTPWYAVLSVRERIAHSRDHGKPAVRVARQEA
jgi:hypothetical protein